MSLENTGEMQLLHHELETWIAFEKEKGSSLQEDTTLDRIQEKIEKYLTSKDLSNEHQLCGILENYGWLATHFAEPIDVVEFSQTLFYTVDVLAVMNLGSVNNNLKQQMELHSSMHFVPQLLIKLLHYELSVPVFNSSNINNINVASIPHNFSRVSSESSFNSNNINIPFSATRSNSMMRSGDQYNLQPKNVTFPAVVLLADISGFTRLSGQYCSMGKDGIDNLQIVTNGYMGKLVEVIYKYNGDIIKFAGDALICVFAEEVAMERSFLQKYIGSSRDLECKASDASAFDDNVSIIEMLPEEQHHPHVGRRGITTKQDSHSFMLSGGGNIHSHSRQAVAALKCALELRTISTSTLSVHVAISCGDISFAVLGGYRNKYECLISGRCLLDLSTCLDDAPSKCIAFTEEVALELGNEIIEKVGAKKASTSGNYVISSDSVDKASASSVKSNATAEVIAGIDKIFVNTQQSHFNAARHILMSRSPVVSRSHSKVFPNLNVNTSAPANGHNTSNSPKSARRVASRQNSLINTALTLHSQTQQSQGSAAILHAINNVAVNPNLNNVNNSSSSNNKQLLSLVDQFVPMPVLQGLESGGLKYLAEIREVTTIFLKIDDYDYDNVDTLAMLQEIFYFIQAIIFQYGAFLRQFLVDDKGCVIILCFGVPTSSFLNNSHRALAVAMLIHRYFAQLSAEDSNKKQTCSIGITTGNVYCGFVGSEARREYAAIGDVVNLSARLMSKAHGRIYIDEATFYRLPSEYVSQTLFYDDLEGNDDHGDTMHPDTTTGNNDASSGQDSLFIGLPPMTVKGKSEPINVFVVNMDSLSEQRNQTLLQEMISSALHHGNHHASTKVTSHNSATSAKVIMDTTHTTAITNTPLIATRNSSANNSMYNVNDNGASSSGAQGNKVVIEVFESFKAKLLKMLDDSMSIMRSRSSIFDKSQRQPHRRLSSNVISIYNSLKENLREGSVKVSNSISSNGSNGSNTTNNANTNNAASNLSALFRVIVVEAKIGSNFIPLQQFFTKEATKRRMQVIQHSELLDLDAKDKLVEFRLLQRLLLVFLQVKDPKNQHEIRSKAKALIDKVFKVASIANIGSTISTDSNKEINTNTNSNAGSSSFRTYSSEQVDGVVWPLMQKILGLASNKSSSKGSTLGQGTKNSTTNLNNSFNGSIRKKNTNNNNNNNNNNNILYNNSINRNSLRNTNNVNNSVLLRDKGTIKSILHELFHFLLFQSNTMTSGSSSNVSEESKTNPGTSSKTPRPGRGNHSATKVIVINNIHNADNDSLQCLSSWIDLFNNNTNTNNNSHSNARILSSCVLFTTLVNMTELHSYEEIGGYSNKSYSLFHGLKRNTLIDISNSHQKLPNHNSHHTSNQHSNHNSKTTKSDGSSTSMSGQKMRKQDPGSMTMLDRFIEKVQQHSPDYKPHTHTHTNQNNTHNTSTVANNNNSNNASSNEAATTNSRCGIYIKLEEFTVAQIDAIIRANLPHLQFIPLELSKFVQQLSGGSIFWMGEILTFLKKCSEDDILELLDEEEQFLFNEASSGNNSNSVAQGAQAAASAAAHNILSPLSPRVNIFSNNTNTNSSNNTTSANSSFYSANNNAGNGNSGYGRVRSNSRKQSRDFTLALRQAANNVNSANTSLAGNNTPNGARSRSNSIFASTAAGQVANTLNERRKNKLDQIIISRLESLPMDDQRVLKTASTIGFQFSAKVLIHVLPPSLQMNAHRSLQHLQEERWILPLNTSNSSKKYEEMMVNVLDKTEQLFSFHHPLLYELLYNLTPSNDRTSIHNSIAEAYILLSSAAIASLSSTSTDHSVTSNDSSSRRDSGANNNNVNVIVNPKLFMEISRHFYHSNRTKSFEYALKAAKYYLSPEALDLEIALLLIQDSCNSCRHVADVKNVKNVLSRAKFIFRIIDEQQESLFDDDNNNQGQHSINKSEEGYSGYFYYVQAALCYFNCYSYFNNNNTIENAFDNIKVTEEDDNNNASTNSNTNSSACMCCMSSGRGCCSTKRNPSIYPSAYQDLSDDVGASTKQNTTNNNDNSNNNNNSNTEDEDNKLVLDNPNNNTNNSNNNDTPAPSPAKPTEAITNDVPLQTVVYSAAARAMLRKVLKQIELKLNKLHKDFEAADNYGPVQRWKSGIVMLGSTAGAAQSTSKSRFSFGRSFRLSQRKLAIDNAPSDDSVKDSDKSTDSNATLAKSGSFLGLSRSKSKIGLRAQKSVLRMSLEVTKEDDEP